MSMETKKTSRLQKYLTLLKLESSHEMNSANLAKDQQSIDQYTLTKLDLEALAKQPRSQRKVKKYIPVYAIATLAAAIVLFIFVQTQRQDQSDSWQVKGTIGIKIYYKIDDQVIEFIESENLPEHAKVTVQLTAIEDTFALLGATNRESKILLSDEELLANQLIIKKGVTEFFPSGLELTGESEGEKLSIVACEPKVRSTLSKSQLVAFVKTALAKIKTPGKTTFDNCRVYTYQLRK